MKQRYLYFLLAILFFSVTNSACEQQASMSVQDLLDDRENYIDRIVTLEGTVVRHIDDERDFKSYLLQDRYGQVVTIRTIKALPSITDNISVNGTFNEGMMGGNRVFYISEIDRKNAAFFMIDNQLILILFAALILIMIIALLVVYFKKPEEPATVITTGVQEPKPVPPQPDPEPPVVVDNPTIKIVGTSDKTIKVLPGKLEILSGVEGQKELKFLTPPNSRVHEFTFGRNPGTSYSHFQFKSPTVSREQAKLIISRNDFSLINYANEQSNPTQINGEKMAENESRSLNSGDIITMGEVSLKLII